MTLLKSKLMLFLCALLGTVSLYACTNILISAKDDTNIVARTMEFGPDLHSNIMLSPKGRQFETKRKDGTKTLSWQAKYGFVYFSIFQFPHAIDGMNEKGLSLGGLYLPGYTKYQTVPTNKEKTALPYMWFGDWVLSNFATVDEVKAALKNIYVYENPIFIKKKKTVFPLHFIITDAKGKSITVEFIDGQMKVTDNVNGILTNSPPYDWQLNNLKNFANLTPYSPEEIILYGYGYSGTGQGAGAVGLPGDYSPPSRFVRMNFLSQTAFKPKDAKEALNVAQHILNNVDIVDGAVRGSKKSATIPDKTQWTVFKDLTNRVLYFKSYDNTTLQAIDLKQLDLSENAKVLKMPVKHQQIIINVTKQFSAS